jgi:hypothetical protein
MWFVELSFSPVYTRTVYVASVSTTAVRVFYDQTDVFFLHYIYSGWNISWMIKDDSDFPAGARDQLWDPLSFMYNGYRGLILPPPLREYNSEVRELTIQIPLAQRF